MKLSHAVIMTFPSWKWAEYGFCMKGFVDNWPSDVQGYALVEKPEDIPIDIPSNLTVIDFDKEIGPSIKAFEDRNKDKPIFDLGTTGNIGLQAAKFARKAYAQLWVLDNVDADVIWYIDADVVTLAPVTVEMLDKLTFGEAYLGALPRWWKKKNTLEEALTAKQLSVGYTETGLMFWKPKHSAHKEWCQLYRDMYDKDEIFQYDAFHDCISFDRATIQLLLEKKIKIVDLGYGVRSSHPLSQSPLNKWFDHCKGQRKFVGFSKERVRVHGK